MPLRFLSGARVRKVVLWLAFCTFVSEKRNEGKIPQLCRRPQLADACKYGKHGYRTCYPHVHILLAKRMPPFVHQ